MKIMEMMEARLMPAAGALGRNKYLVSVRDGFLVTMPLLIIGSFFMLINYFPIQAWIDLLRRISIAGVSVSALLSTATTATFSLFAVFAVMGIGYNFSRHMGITPIHGAAVALVSWFMLMPMYTLYTPDGAAAAVRVASVPFDWVGTRGVFIGIICAFLSVSLYSFAEKKNWVIKMPAGVPPTVGMSFASLIPAAFVMAVFLVINVLFRFTPWENAFNFVFNFFQLPLQNVSNTVWTMALVYLFAHILWFFGIHGTNITDSVFRPILVTLSGENLAALQSGLPMPNIINQQFQDLFATYGGGGSTLSLLIAALLFCKSQRIRSLGKLSLFPGVFGINEPVIFGLPIVLNPTLLIPFILVPLINIIVTYTAMAIGLVPICNGVIMPWTTPPIISGLLSSGWRGAVLQIIMISVGVAIYLPFIRSLDKQYINEEEAAERNGK